MHRFLVALALLVGLAGPGWAAPPAHDLLVTPAWLAEQLGDPALVVLHPAALRADYERGHVPGARFLWLSDVAPSTCEGTYEMPSARALAAAFERLGVSSDSRVVICHVLGDVTGAARVYVALDYLGLGDRAVILDGGFEAWKAEGRAVAKDAPAIRRGRIVPGDRPGVLAHLEQVRGAAAATGVRLVDARMASAFDSPGTPMAVRGGHLPGAVNLPAGAVTDSLFRYQPADTLRARFARAGIAPGDHLITYCGVGRSACPVYVAARMLGYDVRLYDGSFEEWSRREELPVEGGGRK